MRLLSHWNLRDEIKADYADAKTGLAKQRAIAQVMERIVTQTIPTAVVDNPQRRLESVHERGHGRRRQGLDEATPPAEARATRAEPDTRYAMLLAIFQAARAGRSVLARRRRR